MSKKISVQNVTSQKLLKTDLSTLKFSLNLVGALRAFGNINVSTVDMFGITLIYSVCLLER